MSTFDCLDERACILGKDGYCFHEILYPAAGFLCLSATFSFLLLFSIVHLPFWPARIVRRTHSRAYASFALSSSVALG